MEQTKSRPRHCNDNGLAETKNGAVIRKHMGYGHIAASMPRPSMSSIGEYFNPYLNFHRPCAVPEVVTDKNGKRRRIYRWYATPCEILRQLPGASRFLKADLTLEQLAGIAALKSDTKAAKEMQEAKRRLFASVQRKRSA